MKHQQRCPQCNCEVTEEPATTMTETIEEKYLRKGGLYCPFCESKDIIAKDPSTESMEAWAQVSCNECHGEWNDHYTLEGMEVTHRPPKKIRRR